MCDTVIIHLCDAVITEMCDAVIVNACDAVKIHFQRLREKPGIAKVDILNTSALYSIGYIK